MRPRRKRRRLWSCLVVLNIAIAMFDTQMCGSGAVKLCNLPHIGLSAVDRDHLTGDEA